MVGEQEWRSEEQLGSKSKIEAFPFTLLMLFLKLIQSKEKVRNCDVYYIMIVRCDHACSGQTTK